MCTINLLYNIVSSRCSSKQSKVEPTQKPVFAPEFQLYISNQVFNREKLRVVSRDKNLLQIVEQTIQTDM